MSAQIWIFCICVYEDWPYLFAEAGSQGVPDEDRCRFIDDFYSTPECCREPYFARRLGELYKTAEEMKACPHVWLALCQWPRKGKICNMGLERLLAQIRCAAPPTGIGGKHPPSATRVAGPGLLRSFCKSMWPRVAATRD